MSDETTTHSWIMDVRMRLAKTPVHRLPPSDDRQAAVLVPLYVEARELWTLLVRRSRELPQHGGQIGFPGGGLEAGEEIWDGALRETNEELALEPKTILRLGQLDEIVTDGGYRVVPVVGAVPFPVETDLADGEVEEVIPVPLQALIQPHLVEDRQITVDGETLEIRIYHIGTRRIWGLTARILQDLLVRLGLEPGGPAN